MDKQMAKEILCTMLSRQDHAHQWPNRVWSSSDVMKMTDQAIEATQAIFKEFDNEND